MNEAFLDQLEKYLTERIRFYMGVSCTGSGWDFYPSIAKEKAYRDLNMSSIEISMLDSETIDIADRMIFSASVEASQYYC